MAYVPNNVYIYCAALSGAMSGIAASGRILTDTNSADYATPAQQAEAWAEEFDTLWASGSANIFEVGEASAKSYAVWQTRQPINANAAYLLPSTYLQECSAIIAAIHAADVVITAKGVTPPSATPATTAPGGVDGNYQFNNFGVFGGDGVVTRSGVAKRDLTIFATHIASIGAGLSTNIDGTTLSIGLDGTVTLLQGNTTFTGTSAGSGQFVINLQNNDNDAGPDNALNIRAGGNATVGSVFVQFQRPDLTILASITQSGAGSNSVDFLPGTDNTGNIGSPANRWALVRATVITSGDLGLSCPERNADWMIQEERERITIYNRTTKKRYAFVLEEIEGEELPKPL
jgi:hypothetical protein